MSAGCKFAHASRPFPGQTANGDACFARDVGGGSFFGVVDALGHGPVAAQTADVALAHLQTVDVSKGVTAAMASLHAALRGTRGAAALLCVFNEHVISACGVGNIELRRLGVKLALHLTPGVLGGLLPRGPVAAVGEMPRGSRVVVFSDGVAGRFGEDDVKGDVGAVAARLLQSYARATDDASVLVAEAL